MIWVFWHLSDSFFKELLSLWLIPPDKDTRVLRKSKKNCWIMSVLTDSWWSCSRWRKGTVSAGRRRFIRRCFRHGVRYKGGGRPSCDTCGSRHEEWGGQIPSQGRVGYTKTVRSDTGSHYTIIPPDLFRPSMGKVVAADTIARFVSKIAISQWREKLWTFLTSLS